MTEDIKEKLLETVTEKGGHPIVISEFGSHLYCLNTPDSDHDYKAVFIPSKTQWILGTYPRSFRMSTGKEHVRNTADDVDIEGIAIQQFIRNALQGETFAIDLLHSEHPMLFSWPWTFMVQNRTKFYHKNMKSFVGYARKQAAKYGVKGSRLATLETVLDFLKFVPGETRLEDEIYHLRSITDGMEHIWFDLTGDEHGPKMEIIGKKFGGHTRVSDVFMPLQKAYDGYGHRAQLAKENRGIDWKAVSHALRATYQQELIFTQGDFDYPLPQTEFLLDVKQGKLDFLGDVQPELDRVVDHVTEIADQADLPSEPDRLFWDSFILKLFDSL